MLNRVQNHAGSLPVADIQISRSDIRKIRGLVSRSRISRCANTTLLKGIVQGTAV